MGPSVIVIAPCRTRGRAPQAAVPEPSVALFSDADALRAFDAVETHPPKILALDRTFAFTARGAALVARLKGDQRMGAIDLRVLTEDETNSPMILETKALGLEGALFEGVASASITAAPAVRRGSPRPTPQRRRQRRERNPGQPVVDRRAVACGGTCASRPSGAAAPGAHRLGLRGEGSRRGRLVVCRTKQWRPGVPRRRRIHQPGCAVAGRVLRPPADYLDRSAGRLQVTPFSRSLQPWAQPFRGFGGPSVPDASPAE